MNRVAIVTELKRDEGLRLKPYKDSVGKTTIGVGRNLDDVGITELEAEHLLANDIAVACAELDRECPWWITRPDDAQRAMVNMVFQLGIGRFMGFKKMIACLQAGDYIGASNNALQSKWAEQVPSRAHRIAAMFKNCATGVTS